MIQVSGRVVDRAVADLLIAAEHAIMAMSTAMELPHVECQYGPRRQPLSDRLRTCSVQLQRAANITKRVHTSQKYASLIAAAFAAGSLCLVRRLSPGRCSLALETAVCCTCSPPKLRCPPGPVVLPRASRLSIASSRELSVAVFHCGDLLQVLRHRSWAAHAWPAAGSIRIVAGQRLSAPWR